MAIAAPLFDQIKGWNMFMFIEKCNLGKIIALDQMSPLSNKQDQKVGDSWQSVIMLDICTPEMCERSDQDLQLFFLPRGTFYLWILILPEQSSQTEH